MIGGGQIARGDLVQNTRTGDVHWVTPGAAIPVTADELRFGPGVLIPYTSGERYVEAVLNMIGADVLNALSWDWPAPYNGEQRRARRRLEGKVVALEKIVNTAGEELVRVAQLLRNPYPPGHWPPYHVLGDPA